MISLRLSTVLGLKEFKSLLRIFSKTYLEVFTFFKLLAMHYYYNPSPHSKNLNVLQSEI